MLEGSTALDRSETQTEAKGRRLQQFLELWLRSYMHSTRHSVVRGPSEEKAEPKSWKQSHRSDKLHGEGETRLLLQLAD